MKKNEMIDLNICSSKYGLPLVQAIKNNDLKLARKMLMISSSHESSNIDLDINCIDNEGSNAMHVLMSNFGVDS